MDNSARLFSILNKPISEKVDLLIGKPIESEITTADILKGVVSLIVDYAVLEPTFCPMFAQLCSDLNRKLSGVPSDKPGGKEMITVKRVLLNACQEAFEGLDKLREELMQMNASPEKETKERIVKQRGFVSIRLLIGELVKLNMVPERIVHHIVQDLLGHDNKTCPDEANMEAICQLFQTIGKQLDENPKSRRVNDTYFIRLKEFSTNPQLPSRMRFMVRDILDLRMNRWEKVKIYREIHNEEKHRSRGHPSSILDIHGSEQPPPMFRKKPLANQRFPSPRIVGLTTAKYNALVHACGGFTPIRSEEYFWYPLVDGVMKIVGSSSSGNVLLTAQADDVAACKSHIS